MNADPNTAGEALLVVSDILAALEDLSDLAPPQDPMIDPGRTMPQGQTAMMSLEPGDCRDAGRRIVSDTLSSWVLTLKVSHAGTAVPSAWRSSLALGTWHTRGLFLRERHA
ncbi:MAG: hypothetical protein ABSG17_21780 [Spirochaetia bacterium]|jgi:hypothetical protein